MRTIRAGTKEVLSRAKAKAPDSSSGRMVYIFTNSTWSRPPTKIDVKLKDGREFSAKVVGSDEKTDIAVIKIDAKDLPVVQLGDSDAVRIGQFRVRESARRSSSITRSPTAWLAAKAAAIARDQRLFDLGLFAN